MSLRKEQKPRVVIWKLQRGLWRSTSAPASSVQKSEDSVAPYQMNRSRARDDLNATSPAKKRRLAQEGRITPVDELEQRSKPSHSVPGNVPVIGSTPRISRGGGNPMCKMLHVLASSEANVDVLAVGKQAVQVQTTIPPLCRSLTEAESVL